MPFVSRHRSLPALVLAVHCLVLRPGVALAEDLFSFRILPHRGRAVAAELAELNGDGRTDLFIVSLDGVPPKDERLFAVYLQRKDGSLPTTPDYRVPVPQWSTVYDVAEVRDDMPGAEIVLLQPDAVTLLSLASPEGLQHKLPVPGPTSVGLADDERGFETFQLVHREFGEEPWIIAQQMGELTALSPQGEIKARLAIPRRANYLILPRTGLISIESDFQIFLDVPKLAIGDVNGDGRVDFVSSTRHEARVFLRREDGGYDFEPSMLVPFEKVTPRDHIRGSGGVAAEFRDIDGDGRLDLLVAHVKGGFSDLVTEISIFMNRAGRWRIGKPDQVMTAKGRIGTAALVDVERDGRYEMLRVEISFSLLEVVELLLAKEVDLDIQLYRLEESGRFADRPASRKKLSIPISFETFRPQGFIPVANQDLNGDGRFDFVASGEGKAIEVWIGAENGLFDLETERQKMPTAGVIHFGDYDSDGLQDVVIFDPHNFDVPVKVGINRGKMPGIPSLRRLESRR